MLVKLAAASRERAVSVLAEKEQANEAEIVMARRLKMPAHLLANCAKKLTKQPASTFALAHSGWSPCIAGT
jgi:hypothetical protein